MGRHNPQPLPPLKPAQAHCDPFALLAGFIPDANTAQHDFFSLTPHRRPRQVELVQKGKLAQPHHR